MLVEACKESVDDSKQLLGWICRFFDVPLNSVTNGCRGFVMAMMIIYLLLAIPLRSYSQPLVIMAIIPFGTVGALLGHKVMGWDVVFFSILGIVR